VAVGIASEILVYVDRMGKDDDVVRNYLQFLMDPLKLADPEELKRLKRIARTRSIDPIERLIAHNRIRALTVGFEAAGPLREEFIRHAKSWAEANGIAPGAFQAFGVDDATLRAAGLLTAKGKARKRPARRYVSVQAVQAVARRQKDVFTYADLKRLCEGGSRMTIRNAVAELVAAGEIEVLGPTPNRSKHGRPPVLFRVVR